MTEEDRQTIAGIGGKIVDGLKQSPMLLAIVILNIFVVGGILWSVREERVLRAEVTKNEQELIGDMARLLADLEPKK